MTDTGTDTGTGTGTDTDTDTVLRDRHLARARSAHDRATAACRYAGVGEDQARLVPTGAASRAANAVRLSAEAIAAFDGSVPDPAADARRARNAAAAAVLAAQVAQAHGGAGELSDAAYRAFLTASQAAGQAAGREGLGRSEALNADADAAEEAAVAAAGAAGWR